MMSIERARQFYMENRDKFPGMSMTDAVTQIARSGGAPIAGQAAQGQAPVAIPAAAAVPVQTSAQAPAPVTEAPVEEVVVEQPVYNSPSQAAMAALMAARQAPAAGARTGIVDKARQELDADQLEYLQLKVAAEQGAQVDPDLQKAIDSRIARTTEEIANVDKERQQAIWMAIAQAGARMAQSQSPYFMQALASGMEAGLTGYDAAKAKAAEKKARLQDTKEDLAIKLVELRNQARDAASAAVDTSMQGAAARQTAKAGAIKGAILSETADEAVAGEELRNQVLREQIANARQSRSLAAAASARAERAARAGAGGGGGGGGGGVKLPQLNAIVNGAISENDRLQESLQDPLMSSQMSKAQKNQYRARIAENNRIIAYGRSLQKQKIGMGSGFKLLGPE